MISLLAACLPLSIWIYLVTARGGFWRVSKHLAPITTSSVYTKRVVAVVPARDEAEVIHQAITSLLGQNISPSIDVVLVDDSSSDGTADIARAAADSLGKQDRLTILDGLPLPEGWTGKMWAVAQGIRVAETLCPDFLLLTDGDISHSPDNVAELVSIAEQHRCDLASYMVKLATVTVAERALIPAFVFFFFMLYPPAWIYSSRRRTAGAAGGCILIRREVLERIGGIASIRNQVIDDCALAQAVKDYGGRLWLGLTPGTSSIRSYGSFAGIGNMIARTAFNQLNHSPLLLIGTVAGLFFTYALPPLLVFKGSPVQRRLGGAAWLLMSAAYLPTVRFYKRSLLWSIALPPISLFYMGATFYSALRYWRRQGGAWKGRVQDVRSGNRVLPRPA